MMKTMPKIRVDVISDTVCPWCYVGKRRLEQAMSSLKGQADFEVVWHPFQLNPAAPQQGEDKLTFYKKKFGPRVESMLPMMTKTFADVGLKYSIGGLTGNTLNSHLLIHWAGKTAGTQVQNALMEELFSNYFCEEKYINDKDVLLSAVSKVGLDAKAAETVLAAPGELKGEVEMALSYGRQMGVSGVPFFTIDKRYTVSGAEAPETFIKIFEKIASTGSTPQGQVEGAVCLPGGECL